MRRGQEAARRFHGKSERSSGFLCLPDLEDFLLFFFVCTQGKRSGLQGNTKARSAAVHYKQLLAVGPEKLHTVGTEKKHGVTETYKALPRKDIFRTFNVVRRKTPPNTIWRS